MKLIQVSNETALTIAEGSTSNNNIWLE